MEGLSFLVSHPWVSRFVRAGAIVFGGSVMSSTSEKSVYDYLSQGGDIDVMITFEKVECIPHDPQSAYPMKTFERSRLDEALCLISTVIGKENVDRIRVSSLPF